MIAAVLLALLNAWVAWRLPLLLQDSSAGEAILLERRVAAFRPKEKVEVLIFGNSHAIAGLRPPAIARAMGLSPDQVFSLALPGSNMHEMHLLADRYASQFPSARLVLIGVDEYALTASKDYRLRYLTRASIAERWRHATAQADLDAGAREMCGLVFPLLDFKEPLMERPALTAARLWTDQRRTDSFCAKANQIDYAWGFPPVWDHLPLELTPLERRARHFLSGSSRLDKGLVDLERLAAHFRDKQARVVLVEMPYAEALLALLRGPSYQAYREKLAAYLKASSRDWIAAPRPMPRAVFYDADHLTGEGAARLAGVIKARLGAGPSDLPLHADYDR